MSETATRLQKDGTLWKALGEIIFKLGTHLEFSIVLYLAYLNIFISSYCIAVSSIYLSKEDASHSIAGITRVCCVFCRRRDSHAHPTTPTSIATSWPLAAPSDGPSICCADFFFPAPDRLVREIFFKLKRSHSTSVPSPRRYRLANPMYLAFWLPHQPCIRPQQRQPFQRADDRSGENAMRWVSVEIEVEKSVNDAVFIAVRAFDVIARWCSLDAGESTAGGLPGGLFMMAGCFDREAQRHQRLIQHGASLGGR